MKLLADLSRMAMEMAFTLVVVLTGAWIRGVEITAASMVEQTILFVVVAILLAVLWTVLYIARLLYHRFWGAA